MRNHFVDVDGGGEVAPLDVLLVINALNARQSLAGEGEQSVEFSLQYPTTWAADTVDLAMLDFYFDPSQAEGHLRRRIVANSGGRTHRKS